MLDLLAAIALLVWGTHLVRTGILRVFGANLRQMLARSIGNRYAAAVAGIGVTALVQSSTATALIVFSFAGQGLVSLPLALAVMLDADIGTSVMAVVFSFDLSWLSPLFIFIGVVLFHFTFNVLVGLTFIGWTQVIARWVEILLPKPNRSGGNGRQNHLDPSALATPSLAISCAAREALHQADMVETMLRGLLVVIQNDDIKLAEELRKMDDTVDELYSSIKYYLTKISREALAEEESRRWTDIISFTINMEQIGDNIERVPIDIEDKKIKPRRHFSEADMAEITELHNRLGDNLRLGMSVFLNGSVRDAQKLLEEKARFRDLEHA